MNAAADRSEPVPSRIVTQEEMKRYQEEGYLLLPGLISPDEAAALRREVLEIMEIIGLGQSKLRQTTEYLAESRLDALVNSPNLLAIASRLMDGPSTLYMPFTAVKSGGGGGRFHFHQDNQYTRFDGPGINIWIALNEMTAANGCLQVVPRSHLHGTLEAAAVGDGHRMLTYEPEDFVSVLMQPGDCIAFSRLTVHGSGPNATDEPRVAYALQFHRNDVRALWDGSVGWKLLTENPRWHTAPVAAITPPKEKLEGH